MSNKTFIPAFECLVGDWKYYMAMMKYGEVNRQVAFAHELSSNADLGQLIQRGLSDRTKDITEYLLNSKHRFLGALVVAAWGGQPKYRPLTIDDPDGVLSGIDREFGVLTFDGTQQYFALDGQHRLRAIKDAIKKDPSLAAEDICVLMVTHYDNAEGRIRTRRLFSNINRNAVKTNTAEDIVLDEDDGFAILSRRFLDEHQFLRADGRVKVIVRRGDEGLLKLAGNSISKSDSKSFTTLPVLYDMLRYLGWDLKSDVRSRRARPSEDVLEHSYGVLSSRLNDLLRYCGNLEQRMLDADDARDVRGAKGGESEGHPLMRPVIQKAICKVAGEIVQQGALAWKDVMDRLAALSWQLGSDPWTAVYNRASGKMVTAKENVSVLVALLWVHLAPRSQAEIRRARKSYKETVGRNYGVSEEDLLGGIQGVAAIKDSAPLTDEIEELSNQADEEIAALPGDESD